MPHLTAFFDNDMTVSVIIVTLSRPDCVRRCVDHLRAQTRQPEEVIVVDSSANNLTRDVVEGFPGIVYTRNENGFGRMTASRNIGLKYAKGDVIAFLDDDAFAHPGWLENLLATYGDPDVGAVGGRALNHQPGEERCGVEVIGRLLPNGTHTGNFGADPGRIVEVDHLMGCNMSFRRDVLAKLGGFREDYPGISGVREDTDMCLRVRRANFRLLFNPAAAVDHIGAPQMVGRRFDTRYAYYSARNHVVMLARNGGPLGRYIIWLAVSSMREFVRRLGGAVARLLANAIGTCAGIVSAARLIGKSGRDPIRHDSEAQELRRTLLRVGSFNARSAVQDHAEVTTT